MAKYQSISYHKPKDLKHTLQRLSKYFANSKGELFIAASLALLEGMIMPSGTYALKTIINEIILPMDIEALKRALLLLGFAYAIAFLAICIYPQLAAKAAQRIVYEIRVDLFKHIETLPLSYFDTHRNGDLMSGFSNDMETITEAINNSFTTILQDAAMLLFTFYFLIRMNPCLTLIVLLLLCCTTLLVRYNTKKSRVYYREQQDEIGKLNGYLEEMLNGQKVVKVFNHEDEALAAFDLRNDALRETATSASWHTGVMTPIVTTMGYGNYALSAAGGGLFALAGLMDIGSLTSFLILVRQAAMPFNHITQQINFILSALSGAERVFEMMEEKPEIDEGTITLRQNEDGFFWHDEATDDEIPLQGDIRFENVCFGYTKDKEILHDLNLYALSGEKVAFVGSTGAGKSTVINLVNRFYEIGEGNIRFDGMDVRRLRKADLRHSIAMIVQTTHLFSGTIAENIRYGKMDASDAEVIAAAKLARADGFIRRLPDGYNTMITNDGGNLSQGQRQLLAIARAAISQPPLLVLDEATSSIDTRTERMIEQGLDELMKGRTVLVIAHRLSTVRNADCIMYLENGRITERGSHDALIEKGGSYAALYNGQFLLE